ncbi:MAG: hypothetical protein RLP09_04925 [Sandaracinaceae bacterium]|nr:hypothetical protein [Myxococcales bacterium]
MRGLLAFVFLASSAPSFALADDIGIPEAGESSGEVRVVMHASATYGIGGYSALGVHLTPLVEFSVWNTDAATGSLDFGVVLGWQMEPESLQYQVPSTLDNEAHRLNSWVVFGHSFHLGDRRSTLGVHLFGGWTHVWSVATASDPGRVERSASDDYGLPNIGASLTFDYRFSDYVGFNVQAAGPFQTGSSYVNTLFHVGLGLTGYFR